MIKGRPNIYGVIITIPYITLILLICAYFIDRNADVKLHPEVYEKPYPKLNLGDEQLIDDTDDKKLATLDSTIIKTLAKKQKWSCSKGALGNWKVLQTTHFCITSEASKDENFVAGFCLEEFIKSIGSILPAKRERLFNVRIFKSNEKFKNYAKAKECISASAFYDVDRKEIVVGVKGNFAGDILHEATHAYLDYNFNNVPAWFSEGLAEYFANFEVSGDKIVFGALSKRHITTLRSKLPNSFNYITHLDRETFYKGDYKLAYAESWAIVWAWLNKKMLFGCSKDFAFSHKLD